MNKIAHQHVSSPAAGHGFGNLWRHVTDMFRPAAGGTDAQYPNAWLRHDAEVQSARPGAPMAADYSASFGAMLNRNI